VGPPADPAHCITEGIGARRTATAMIKSAYVRRVTLEEMCRVADVMAPFTSRGKECCWDWAIANSIWEDERTGKCQVVGPQSHSPSRRGRSRGGSTTLRQEYIIFSTRAPLPPSPCVPYSVHTWYSS
jgi:hypothetical protein